MNEPHITTREAADILGRSNWAVIRLVKAGRLVPVRKLAGPRGGYLFDRATVEAFVDEGAE